MVNLRQEKFTIMVLDMNHRFGVSSYMRNRIREHRENLGWSQETLAEKVRTTYQQISRLERSQRKLNTEWMGKLAPALGVPEAALLEGSGISGTTSEASLAAPSAQIIRRAIGNRLNFVRSARMLDDLPDVTAAHLKIESSELRSYEAGEQPVLPEVLVAFCVAFGVSADFILLGKEENLDEFLRVRLPKKART